jgi:hypothetical protein
MWRAIAVENDFSDGRWEMPRRQHFHSPKLSRRRRLIMHGLYWYNDQAALSNCAGGHSFSSDEAGIWARRTTGGNLDMDTSIEAMRAIDARPPTDPTAIITSSTSGIGLGIAQALAAAGADIVLNGDAAMIEGLSVCSSPARPAARSSARPCPSMVAGPRNRPGRGNRIMVVIEPIAISRATHRVQWKPS